MVTRVAQSRMRKEMGEMRTRDGTDNFQINMVGDNMFHWDATLFGPAGTPYANGIFHLDIRIPDNYPFCPPKVRFITRIFHCNVSPSGSICMDILKDEWSPALTLCKVLMSISSLLSECNPDDPLNVDVAQLYRRNQTAHDAQAQEWTRIYASE